MTLPLDKTPRPKLTPEERRARDADRLKSIRLRVVIGQALDDGGITDPAAIGAALGLPAGEATMLLTRHQWRRPEVAEGTDPLPVRGAGAFPLCSQPATVLP